MLMARMGLQIHSLLRSLVSGLIENMFEARMGQGAVGVCVAQHLMILIAVMIILYHIATEQLVQFFTT
jgi:hypothetical protein